MKTYIITYDLLQPGRDYRTLFKALEAYGIRWHALESTWLIRTAQSAAQVRDWLLAHIDGNDRLLVMGLDGEAAWFGFTAEGGNWLHQQLAA